jgi:hypothetical protein
MITNEDTMAKEFDAIIDKEVPSMPKAAGLKANGGVMEPTLGHELDHIVARLEGYIRLIKQFKATL